MEYSDISKATSGVLLSSPDREEFTLALLSLFHVQLTVALLFPITFYLIHFIRKDYHAFLALGPGGTPSTPAGYLRICILRLVTIRNPFQAPSVPPTLHPKIGLLTRTTLPARPGSRPTVVGIAPQRQITQKPGAAMYDALATEIQRLPIAHPNTLYSATSCFEKHSTGIFHRLPCESPPTSSNNNNNNNTFNRSPRPLLFAFGFLYPYI